MSIWNIPDPDRPLSARTALRDLWRLAGLPEDALERLSLTGAEPALPSSFAVGTAAQASVAASALAAAHLWRLASGRPQSVSVDLRHAAIAFRSERYLRVNGAPLADFHDPVTGLYRCGDGRFIRLHANFAHHRDGLLALLACTHDRDAVALALKDVEAIAFESRAAAAGLPVAAMRTSAEWEAHAQGRAVRALPTFTIERIGEAPPRPIEAVSQPLDGLRVLDLTRVIAGPVCGRTLAAHGADVLHVSADHLPSIEALDIDTGRGKLACRIDLRGEAGRATLGALARDADVFVDGYRPGGLAALGFGPAALARLAPGIVCVSLSAWGHAGPWAARRGYDSLVQTASGFNADEADAAHTGAPKPLPAQALDHASGYLMAFAAMAALSRRAREGGSWLVRVSLAQTAAWLRGLGRVEGGLACADPGFDDVRDLIESCASGYGALDAVSHPAKLGATPAHWIRPSVPLGTHAPAWPEPRQRADRGHRR